MTFIFTIVFAGYNKCQHGISFLVILVIVTCQVASEEVVEGAGVAVVYPRHSSETKALLSNRKANGQLLAKTATETRRKKIADVFLIATSYEDCWLHWLESFGIVCRVHNVCWFCGGMF